MLHGSINHVSLTVRDLPEAMKFFGPVLGFLGYELGQITHYPPAETELSVNLNESNGTAVNVWQAKPGLADHPFEVYEPGLHHVAFNVERHEQIDQLAELIPALGGEILDGPGEFGFGPGGYYALYVRGPDRLKLEFVHMPLAEARFRGLRSST